jgi:hypothetical protein
MNFQKLNAGALNYVPHQPYSEVRDLSNRIGFASDYLLLAYAFVNLLAWGT